MKQTSFASAEYAGKKRQTRRKRFLAEMNAVVPWSRLEALIEPHYPKSGKVANEADVVHAHRLLHGQESQVHGDSGYTGLEKRDEITEAQAEGRLRKDIDWRIAMKRGQMQAMPEGPRKRLYEWFERRKTQVRAIVEHPFHVIKNLYGYRKSLPGIAKNEARAKAHAALAPVHRQAPIDRPRGQCVCGMRQGSKAASKRRAMTAEALLLRLRAAVNARRRPCNDHEAR